MPNNIKTISEADFMRQVMLDAQRHDTTLFRNNVGMAWYGAGPDCYQWRGKDLLIKNARPVKYGLGTGTSDLIGISKRMVNGVPVAVFTALEVKSMFGRPTPEQESFVKFVKENGGIASIVKPDCNLPTILKFSTEK